MELEINIYVVKKKYAVLTILLAILFAVRLVIDPQNFADYDAYYVIISNVSVTSIDSYYEWLSYITFHTISGFFAQPVAATYWVYFYNSIIFSVVMVLATRINNVKSSGIILSFSIFAPLLFFVTLRATPAYLLILYAVLLLEKNKKLSIACSLTAIFYHVSALIPFIIIVILIIAPVWIVKKTKYIRYFVCFISIIQIGSFLSGIGLIPSWVSDEISLLENLNKYSVYAEVSEGFSINHYLYLMFSLVLLFIASRWRSSFDGIIYAYFHLMMLVYSLMMVSPVAAYRISIFFLLPLFLLMPWDRIFKHFGGIIYYVAAPLILLFSFSGVLVR